MTETASQISDAGYADLALGQRISDRWPFIELRDASGNCIMRLHNTTAADSRVVPTIVPKKVTYVISITGSDAEIATYKTTYSTTSVTFKYAVMKKGDTEGETDTMATDDFTPATISDTGDTLTLTVDVGVGAGST